jgi:acyl carrier protein phosphodiesterase
MNWLAHAFLSEAKGEERLGNLLADLVKGKDREGLPVGFLHGLRQHQRIDTYTDSHPIVRRSRSRMDGRYRHVRGLIVDVFYDHLLAVRWGRYSAEPLGDFTAGVYAQLRTSGMRLPKLADAVAQRMCREDWLRSYRELAGVEAALRRISRRLGRRFGREFALEGAVRDLAGDFAAFEDDFEQFFPLLRAHVQEHRDAIGSGSL